VSAAPAAFVVSGLSNKRRSIVKMIGGMLLLIGMAGFASALNVSVPEIGPASAGSAIALIAGAVLVMRGRRRN
jgi:hypothetical protein